MRKAKEKITTRESLAPLVKQWRAEGKIVGFTSGSFDILHAGHTAYLEQAKEHCDILIAGINTDESVRQYKGEGRPIVPEKYRVELMAALESIDYVFTFSERRNRQNIETIQPSLYIKAGDYSKSELTSSDVVEQYGGKVLILPLQPGLSTTNIIKKINALSGIADSGEDETVKAKTEKREPAKAVLIDRDGTINVDVEYLHEPEKFELLPNAGEGLKRMQDLGYKIAIVTLQAGIGIGYFTKEDFYKINREMFKQLQPFGVTIDKIYFATHSMTEDGSNPKAELIKRAQEELDLDLKQCVVIGDKTSDLAVGEPFGSKKVGVQTGQACADGKYEVTPDYMAVDLLDAANWLANNS